MESNIYVSDTLDPEPMSISDDSRFATGRRGPTVIHVGTVMRHMTLSITVGDPDVLTGSITLRNKRAMLATTC